MPGRAPSPNSRRGLERGRWRTLPAEGREGDPPAWPLGGHKPKALLERWAQLWATPHAVVWEEERWPHVVARYCRLSLAAEKPGASAAMLAEVRQIEDRLGLSPAAMQKLYWRIGVKAVRPASNVTRLDDYRDLYGVPGVES